MLVFTAGIAAAWFWANANQPSEVRATAQVETESKHEVAQTPRAPIPQADMHPLKVSGESNDASGFGMPHRNATIRTLSQALAAAAFHVAPVQQVPFPAPGDRVTKVYPDGLLLEGTGGIRLRKVKFKNLPESVQRKYGYDPRRAAEYETEQAQAAAEYRVSELRKDAQARARRNAEEQAAPHEGGDRIAILSQIVSDYCKSHTYSKQDSFVCVDMACDVWDMVKTKGIPAKIQVGNVESDIGSLSAANHAWVLAEASPGIWVALETTAGRLVYADENPRYYRGWSFDNPRTFKESFKP
jgi:hypothetical protein